MQHITPDGNPRDLPSAVWCHKKKTQFIGTAYGHPQRMGWEYEEATKTVMQTGNVGRFGKIVAMGKADHRRVWTDAQYIDSTVRLNIQLYLYILQ